VNKPTEMRAREGRRKATGGGKIGPAIQSRRTSQLEVVPGRLLAQPERTEESLVTLKSISGGLAGALPNQIESRPPNAEYQSRKIWKAFATGFPY
jgi:hypothetical protein